MPRTKQDSLRPLPMLRSKGIAMQCGFPDRWLRDARKDGCTAFQPNGSIDPLLLIAWMFRSQSETEEVLDHKDRWTKAKADREELKLQAELAQVVDKGRVKDLTIAKFAQTFSDIEKALYERLPVKIAMLPAAEVLSRIREELPAIIAAQRAALETGFDGIDISILQDEDEPEPEEKKKPRASVTRKRAARTELARTGKKGGRKPAKTKG